MKRYSILICVFVLTAALMTGCGCTGPAMDQTDAPTILPTNEEVVPTTRETTLPTTEATTETTLAPILPSESTGNDIMEDTTGITDTTEPVTGRSMIR
jgi:hypothetical protein